MYGGKFAFQNRLSWLVVGWKFTIFALFCFVFEVKFQVQAPQEDYIRRSDLTEGFLCYDFGGLIFGGAYFRNFTVYFQGLYGDTKLFHIYHMIFLKSFHHYSSYN